MRVSGIGIRVYVGFGVIGVWGLEIRVQGSGIGVWGFRDCKGLRGFGFSGLHADLRIRSIGLNPKPLRQPSNHPPCPIEDHRDISP